MGAKALARQAGAALPGVLLVMFWLTGIGGWLVAHAVWDVRVQVIDDQTDTLARARDAIAEVMAQRLAAVADWQGLLDTGPDIGCGAASPPLPAAVDLAGETARLQTTTDALSRWTAPAHPVWQFVAACEAESLQGDWRGAAAAPWLLAWVANTPDGTGPAPPAQLALHVVALYPGRGRAARTVTVRRFPAQTSTRIIAWHPG